jgi:hypothetical protein
METNQDRIFIAAVELVGTRTESLVYWSKNEINAKDISGAGV